MIASLSILAVYLSLGLPVAVVLIPGCVISGDVMPLYRASMWVVRTGFRVAGVRIEVVGLEGVPSGTACIFMANHVSNLDPPVLLPLIPGRTSVFLKRSLMKIPILGYGMGLARFVPVDRGGDTAAALESTRVAKSLLAEGISITTFVEGTRSRDGRLQPFKKGPFYLGMESGAPLRTDFDLRHRDDDEKGEFENPAGRGSGGFSRAGFACGDGGSRCADAGGARGDCLRIAGVDALTAKPCNVN